MADEREKRIGKIALKVTKQMLDSMPDDAEYVEGTEVLSGKEVKQKFKVDDEFAAKNVERLLKLKFDMAKRKKPKKE